MPFQVILIDAYPRYAPTMEWDTGAGHAIAKFAGFIVACVDNRGTGGKGARKS